MTHEAYPTSELPAEDDSRWRVEEPLLYGLIDRNPALGDLFDVILPENGLHLAKPIRLMIQVLATRLETDADLSASKKHDYQEVIFWLRHLDEKISEREDRTLRQAEIGLILDGTSIQSRLDTVLVAFLPAVPAGTEYMELVKRWSAFCNAHLSGTVPQLTDYITPEHIKAAGIDVACYRQVILALGIEANKLREETGGNQNLSDV